MSVSHLAVVRTEENSDSPAARAQRLYAEAQAAALEQVKALETSLAKVVGLAGEIAEGGDVYPAGVRDLCRRLGDDMSQRANTLDALAQRALDQRGMDQRGMDQRGMDQLGMDQRGLDRPH